MSEALYKCGQMIGAWRIVKVWEEGTVYWYALQVGRHTLNGVHESDVASFGTSDADSSDSTDPE